MTTIISAGRMFMSNSMNYQPSYLRLYEDNVFSYGELYRLQPNVRTCVDFIARNIAQLGLHIYRRVSDIDREHLTDHPAARLLKRPLPPAYKMTRHRMVNAWLADLGVYFNAYHLKLREGGETVGLFRLPPTAVSVVGESYPVGYEVNVGGKVYPFAPEDILHIWGYNPASAVLGLSPLETLRRILAEEAAAGEYREQFWKNSARQSGVVERPALAPEWGDAARSRFREQFEALYSGAQASGRTAVLEEGMTWRPISFSAKDSEYLGARRLTQEECARAFHIPPPMIGLLEHATLTNVREYHTQLYQDTLGPWLSLVQDDINLQLLSEWEDESLYAEFNIMEKLRGDFDSQVMSLQASVGRPWMTVNEARARVNMPALDGGDELTTPLNVLIGGQASPRDATPDEDDPASPVMPPLKSRGRKAALERVEALRESHAAEWRRSLAGYYERVEASVMSRHGAASTADPYELLYDLESRWNPELAEDLAKLNIKTIGEYAALILGELGMVFLPHTVEAWTAEHSQIQAENINQYMADQVNGLYTAAGAVVTGVMLKELFDMARTTWAARQAESAVTTAGNFGMQEGATQGRLKKKTWRVTSSKPRDLHLGMDGETVPIDAKFSNGMKWPGDPAGGAENNANCKCIVVFS